MPPATQWGVKQRCWRWIKRGAGLVLLLSLVLGASLFYLHWQGVPDFLIKQLESHLAERGLTIQFGRLWLRGSTLMAENVRLRPTQESSPILLFGNAELKLQAQALAQGRLQPEQLRLQNGQVLWSLAVSNGPPTQVSMDELAAELHFLPQDRWELVQLNSRLFGATLHFSGALTNVSVLGNWAKRRDPTAAKTDWRARVETILTHARELRFVAPSVLTLGIGGDARQLSTFHLNLDLQTPKAAWRQTVVEDLNCKLTATPSLGHAGRLALEGIVHLRQATAENVQLRQLNLSARGFGFGTNEQLAQLNWQLQLDQFQAHALTGQSLVLSAQSAEKPGGTFSTSLQADLLSLQGPWANTFTNHLTAQVEHGWHTADPWAARWEARSGPVASPWGQLSQAHARGQLSPAENGAGEASASLGYWANLQPFRLDWEWEVFDVQSANLRLEKVSSVGQWRAPDVMVDSLRAELAGGQIQSSGRLDVLTRELQLNTELNIDPCQVSPLLSPAVGDWLNQFGWRVPPNASGQVALRLPPWTNAPSNWLAEVLPTVGLTGEFSASDTTFRGLPLAYVRSHFTLTNLLVRVPDLLIKRPDGEVTLEYTGHLGTQEFDSRLESRLDPLAFKPLCQTEAALNALGLFKFNSPPVFQGQVWGRWSELENIAVRGHLSATNFLFRGEVCNWLDSELRLTNSLLHFSNLILRHDQQQLSVPTGAYDLIERVVYVTNALSTMDPDLVTRVIGEKVRAAVKPYHFVQPPTVRVNGRLPTVNVQDADVRFEVKGGPLSYWRLQAPQVEGYVDWRGDSLVITNVEALFYGGKLHWNGQFDFSVPIGAQLAFEGAVENADLHPLSIDLGRKDSQLEGSVSGRLKITNANSDDWRSWDGFGQVWLRNGFLWDIPIFGFFSPMLNKIVPGLGHSPISAGDTHFSINQSVVRTRDLDLKSPALRLAYTGSVDFKGKVNARMRAEILRETWGIGRLLSMAFWPISKAFEYRITGTVFQPKNEPVFIPKPLLWPLQPFKTIKKIFHAESQPPELPSEEPPSGLGLPGNLETEPDPFPNSP